MFKRAFQALTGARPGEQISTLLSFFAVLFLLLSYYLVKPLRESLFMSHFVSRDQAWFSLPIIVLSLASAKFFSFWVGKVSRYRLMIITYLLMLGCKLGFFLILPYAGRWGAAAFFLWVSVYFALVLSILWGVINSIFSAQQAQRCFGFVALGGTTGNILGAQLSAWLADSAFKDWALPFSMVSMSLALGLILLAVGQGDTQPESGPKPESAAPKHVSRGWQDIVGLFNNRYIRGIAMSVYALALISQAFQFQAYGQLDRNLARQVYHQQFGWFDAPDRQFETIYGLKRLEPAAQNQILQQLAGSAPAAQSTQARLSQSYQAYQKQFEIRYRTAISDVFKFQGFLGVFLLMVVARLLFRYVGLRWVVLVLPLFYALASLCVMFPQEVLVLEMLMVLGGSLNYSLNNATKELLYTPTSEAVRFQFKPLIEGPVMRMGDLTASMLQLAVGATLTVWFSLGDMSAGNLLLAMGLVFVALWMLAVFQTGKRYDTAQATLPPQGELDLQG